MWYPLTVVPLPLAIACLLPGLAAAEPAGCRELLRHVPRADVTYQPGVDARGRTVAPADLYPPPAVPAQGRVFIPLTVPLKALRGAPRRTYDSSEVYVGEVAVDLATGELWFDGEPLSRPDQSALIGWCRGDGGLPPPLPAHKPKP